MKNSTKTFVSLLLLATSLSVSACSGVKEPVDSVPVTAMTLNHKSLALFSGETSDLEVESLPRTSEKATFKYSSSDSKIASVDKEGLVTAKKPGKAVISVSTLDGSLVKECPVVVTEKGIRKSEGKKIGSGILAKQKEKGLVAKKARIHEDLDSSVIKNEKTIRRTLSDEDMIISLDDAFFYVGGVDKDSKTDDGAYTISEWGWWFYTNSSYETYIFHKMGNVQNYTTVSTQSFMGKAPRYEAMYSVLDNIFNAGRDIVLDTCLGNILFDEDLATAQGSFNKALIDYADTFGSNNDESLMFEFAQEGDSVADIDDENDYDIPGGTVYQLTQSIRLTVDNCVGFNKTVYQQMDYEIDSDKYSQPFAAEYTIDSSEFEVEIPNVDDFGLVEDIFSL